MKTMLALAQELDVPKLKVYRCIKRFSIDTIQRNGVIYLDDTAENKVRSALEGSTPFLSDTVDTVQTVSGDTAMIHLLKSQLETKDAQITTLMDELTKEREHNRLQAERIAELAAKAQQLTEQAHTVQLAQLTKGKPLALFGAVSQPSFLARLFKRKDNDQ